MNAAVPLRWRTVWVGLGWLLVGTIVWLSLTPSPPSIEVRFGDKLGHFAAYGALMYWFCQLYAGPRARVQLAIAFAAMGVALEFLQGMLGVRMYEFLDMLANAVGVAAGWLGARVTGIRPLAALDAALSRARR